MSISLQSIIEAIKSGYSAFVVVNGEYYELNPEEIENAAKERSAILEEKKSDDLPF